MKFQAALLVLTAAVSLTPANPALADQFKLPEEIGRVEAPRDMNIFQVEPTIVNERYYTSGRGERHQFIGNTLPVGSPIPDTDGPVSTALPSTGVIPSATPYAVPAGIKPVQILQNGTNSVRPAQAIQHVPGTNGSAK